MTPDDRDALTRAREALARVRLTLARRIAATNDLDLSNVEALTKVLGAIESIDRALVDAGHPFMPAGLGADPAP
ncbi:conserved hypothetical protein [Methylobacterium sp. 4-46]|uniref:hypothetical protein n=1 Tax=unclassified Methylobacterium TaxID=2615210 RepID=UPI000165CB5F|nr:MULTISPECIES: hypothetical protein [Methylobacterium]ACA19293.1 conserved hypothetical protein [Methylobacterium sp. 4-46]WFT78495.1 hypothetical protein QA634_24950 [Methylobacterium nodulans]